jgi:hypothetical protein
MESIDNKGMKAAELTEEQFSQLRQTEQRLNNVAGNNREIYLLQPPGRNQALKSGA